MGLGHHGNTVNTMAAAAGRGRVINNWITEQRQKAGQTHAAPWSLDKGEFNTNSCTSTGSAKPGLSGPSLFKEKKATNRIDGPFHYVIASLTSLF